MVGYINIGPDVNNYARGPRIQYACILFLAVNWVCQECKQKYQTALSTCSVCHSDNLAPISEQLPAQVNAGLAEAIGKIVHPENADRSLTRPLSDTDVAVRLLMLGAFLLALLLLTGVF
jgi:hypothetical protein